MYTAILVSTLSVSVCPVPQGPLPSDRLNAVMLIQAPVGAKETVPPEDQWVTVRDAIHHVAIEWQIMDQREARYLLSTRDDFQADLNVLRQRYNDLKDVPLIEMITFKFPSRAVVTESINFNRAFQKHLESRLAWEKDREDVLFAALCETEVCYRAWDAIRDMQCDFYYITVRRAAYKKYLCILKNEKWVGDEIYPSVPIWRFRNQ